MVDVCNNVVLHLLPRPAAFAGGAVGGRDRDRASDQDQRELLECAARTRDTRAGSPPRGVNISDTLGQWSAQRGAAVQDAVAGIFSTAVGVAVGAVAS